MILKNPDNRKLIIEYLESLTEDDFIDQFIIPIFTNFGYRVHRHVAHGPGEHGKDVIFAKYDPLHMADEYIVVQAKAEKANAGNVSHFADQINRAMKVGFPRLGAPGNDRPHFAFFMNSHTHTNDAYQEFNALLTHKRHTRVFSQEHMTDLIMITGVAPNQLLSQLTISSPLDPQNINSRVHAVLMKDRPDEVNHIMDHELKLLHQYLSPDMRRLVVDFIIKKWDEDPSFAGIVRPARWLNEYFGFIAKDQYHYLMRIIDEHAGSTSYSYDAENDVNKIFRRITPDQVLAFENKFLEKLALGVYTRSRNWDDLVKLAEGLKKIGKLKCPLADLVFELSDQRKNKKDLTRIAELENQIEKALYPN